MRGLYVILGNAGRSAAKHWPTVHRAGPPGIAPAEELEADSLDRSDTGGSYPRRGVPPSAGGNPPHIQNFYEYGSAANRQHLSVA